MDSSSGEAGRLHPHSVAIEEHPEIQIRGLRALSRRREIVVTQIGRDAGRSASYAIAADDYKDVFGPDGPLARALPGLCVRPEQSAMAAAVGRALAHSEPLIVEAGTGTGKTFAYLVPALLSGSSVIISTGTGPCRINCFGVTYLCWRERWVCRSRWRCSRDGRIICADIDWS